MLGKNYILEITLEALDPEKERDFEKKIREGLIRPMDSTDLGETTDQNVLHTFWRQAEEAFPELLFSAMTLVRDETARTTVTA